MLFNKSKQLSIDYSIEKNKLVPALLYSKVKLKLESARFFKTLLITGCNGVQNGRAQTSAIK